MKKIFKYKLKMLRKETIALVRNAEILSIQKQGDDVCMWALIDPDDDVEEDRIIFCFGTGHEIYQHEFLDYIATIQEGELVWHFFEYNKIFDS